MRVLRCPNDTVREIESTIDPAVAQLLARQIQFMSEDEGEESLTVLMVEPGDTLEELDAALYHQLLVNDYSGRRYDDAGFIPCFETLLEHPTFYEMFLVEGGGEVGISVLIPKSPETDQEILALCVRPTHFATGRWSRRSKPRASSLRPPISSTSETRLRNSACAVLPRCRSRLSRRIR